MTSRAPRSTDRDGQDRKLIMELRKELTDLDRHPQHAAAARVSEWTAYFLLGELISSAPPRLFTSPRDSRTETT